MGIFDFLATDKQMGRRKKKYDPDDTSDLGLGGLKSLLGTRGAASKDARGDAMMSKTANDKLPGYFNPETREYVPWYVDLFDGGGLNQSEGLLGKDAQEIPTAVGLLETNGAPVQRAAQMRPQMRPDPLDPFGGAGPNIQENPLGPFGGSGPNIPENPLGPFGGVGPYGNWSGNEAGMGGGEVVSNSQMNQEMYGYDYPTEFKLGAEPSSLLSVDQPIFSGEEKDGFMELSQPSDRAIQRNMPAYPAQVAGVVGTDAMMGRQVNPISQANAAEFQRFRAKFEDLLRRNGQWGFPDREADAFQALKASGQNY